MKSPFKLMPGRGNMPKTGRGIPPTLMSCSPAKQIDPPGKKKQTKTGDELQAKAQAEANKKLEANIAAKPLGGSSDVRRETATATNIRPAKTAEEIAKWKAGKDKPGAGRFNRTVTAEASAQGKDTPVTPKVSVESPKENVPSVSVPKENTKTYYRFNTNQNFGSRAVQGLTDDKTILEGYRTKIAADTNKDNAKLGSAFTTGNANTYREKAQTPDEARLQAKGLLPTGYNPLNASESRNKEYLGQVLEKEKKYDAKVADKEAKAKAVKDKIAAKRAQINSKTSTPAQQKKKKIKK